MSYDRILGQHIELHMYSASSNTFVTIGEIDSISIADKSTIVQNQPLYQTVARPQVIPGGWELQCKGGKINGALQQAILDRDNHLLVGNASPRYTLTETTHYYGNPPTSDTYAYCDGVIYGFKFDASKADQEVTEDFTFAATYREARSGVPIPSVSPNLGPTIDTYGINGAPGPT